MEDAGFEGRQRAETIARWPQRIRRGVIDARCGLIAGNSSDQGHPGRFIDASRYIHGGNQS